MISKIYRAVDAELNRCCEAIRVIEDSARFIFDSEILSTKLREFRHTLRQLFVPIQNRLLATRDSNFDVGKKISSNAIDDNRSNLGELLKANFKRSQEALRALEENAKIVLNHEAAKIIETLRFEFYDLEKEFEIFLPPKIPCGLYGITDERFSNGRDAIFQVRQMCDAGVKIIQYREKYRAHKERFAIAKEIRKITADSGTLFIVNDHIDIALLADADGVHIGQDDLDVNEARKLLSPKMILGLSTHNKEQYMSAQKSGANYIGVGPIFKTATKENVCAPVGLEYLEFAASENKIDFVAIGGIKDHNLIDVLNGGAKTVALVSEIVGASDIKLMAQKINNQIINYIQAKGEKDE